MDMFGNRLAAAAVIGSGTSLNNIINRANHLWVPERAAPPAGAEPHNGSRTYTHIHAHLQVPHAARVYYERGPEADFRGEGAARLAVSLSRIHLMLLDYYYY
jgi:hypothetical protein